MKTITSSIMSKKKASKSAFYDPKKKIVFGNIKHSDNERYIFLSKSGPGDNVYCDVKSLSGNNEDVSMSGVNSGSLLGSAATTPKINFGGATTLSKFEEIIRSTFTSEKSIEMATSLAREKGINSFLIGKDFVCVAKTVRDHEIWTFRDWFRALLFTLSMGTIAHNLGTFLEGAGEKTCIINRSIETGNRIYCAVVGFDSNNNLEFVFHTELILGSVKLSWTKIDLVWCEKYGRFGHSVLKCDVPVASTSKSSKTFKKVVSDKCHLQLAKLYEKKSWSLLVSADTSSLNAYLASLEQFLELLIDQVSVLTTIVAAKEDLALNMIVNSPELVLLLSFSASLNISTLGLNSSKVLMTKVGSLESKLVAFEASVGSVLAKLDYLCAGLSINVPAKQEDIAGKFEDVCVFTFGLNSGYLGANVVVIMDSFLAKHVYKISEVPGLFLSIRLLFKNKLSVLVLGLYAGALSVLELLVLKIVKAFCEEDVNRFAFLMKYWDSLDNVKALIVQDIVNSGVGFDHVYLALFST
ncbi:hypothetical protein G9A89_004863 [Geosiphon pyriformis]|nr:hypothetical protein G9A89_004863 [Geosiphon pyriformis]